MTIKYLLTSQEIGDAIVNYIGTFKEGKAFFPYTIVDHEGSLDSTKDVTFTIEMIPKGSRNIKHNMKKVPKKDDPKNIFGKDI